MDSTTLLLGDDEPRPGRRGAHLVLALEAAHPVAPTARHLLARTDQVVIGRGEAGACERLRENELRTLRLQVPDRAMSVLHARLLRDGGGWEVVDAGSKNGTLVNGASVTRAHLADGDLVELGRSFFVFRDAWPDDGPADVTAEQGDLATLVPELAARFRDVTKVASAPVSLLLLGESGTGKEVVARAVHRLSGRPGSFVAVNCGALPAHLVEAELFGHKKGAFTGATDDRLGYLRAAHRGTLLLDEIGDLPASSQAALLRVLQEREVVPVGETRPVKVDLRLVAATHRDLTALQVAGSFRGDLMSRLAGHTVRLLPLRERREDLGILIGALLRRQASRPDDVRFTAPAARALFRYAFPANVRELDKLLGAALALAGDEPIAPRHLPEAVRAPASPPPRGEDRRDELAAALSEHRGNVAAVARQLGTTRMQIHRLVKRYGIDLRSYR